MTTKSQPLQVAITMPRIDTHAHFHGPIPELETYAISEQEMDSIATIRLQHYHTIAVGAEMLYGIKAGALLLKNKHRAVLAKARALRKKLVRILCRKHSKQHTSQPGSVSVIFFVRMYLKKAVVPSAKFLAYTDPAVVGQPVQGDSYISGLERVHGRLNNIEDLLSAIESAMKKWKANKIVGMKVGLAYHDHGLDLRNPLLMNKLKRHSTNETE